VDSVARLRARLDDYKVGSQVRVTVLNGGNRREVLITLQPGT
jgi:S1-C subfamily serine protease